MKMRFLLPFLMTMCVFASCGSTGVKYYKVEVVAEYDHDVNAYTQGLFFQDGTLYESTGQNGESSFRKVDLQSGKVLEQMNFDEKYFVEGSVILEDNLYILTWESRVAFVYDANTLKYKSTWKYPREGWGLATDGKRLIASDGSPFIYFMDNDFKLERKVTVRLNDRPVRWLNELEVINGKIWANVYTSDEIVIINPKDGTVEGVIDCKGLLPSSLRTPDTDVLNGIAYDKKTGKIYLTGKNWPKLYEVRIVEKD